MELRFNVYGVFLGDARGLQSGLQRFHLERCGASMVREKMQSPLFRDGELRAFRRFMDKIGPSRVPTIRIYRLEALQEQKRTRFRKQTRVGEVLLSAFRTIPFSFATIYAQNSARETSCSESFVQTAPTALAEWFP